MPVNEIRVAGFGGQGVIMAANVIGKANCLYQEGYSTMVQNFGPEARGGACSAGLILSDEPILYPYLTEPEVMIVMSQEAFTKFAPEISAKGVMLVEQDLVRVSNLKTGVRVYSIPATRIAEQLGKRMMQNIVMVGYFAAVTGLVSVEALKKAVASSVPPHTRELNLQAFDAGFAHASAAAEPAEVHA
jgi:2-oxoglutarate ferredoxin oxidoreductase subunit gamma